MNVNVALRGRSNTTDKRPQAIAAGLEAAGCKITAISRADRCEKDCDLLIQAGFAKSNAIMDAINRGIPYIVAEEAFLRHFESWKPETWVSYTYCGMNGLGHWADTPKKRIWMPPLKPMRPETGGIKAIIAQCVNDHQLRGLDHVAWLREMMEKYPDAEVRPHPKFVPSGSLEPLDEFFARIDSLVSFNSTQGAEALYEGLPVEIHHAGSMAYDVQDRNQWAKDLSWRHFPLGVAATGEIGRVILSGYDEALEIAQKRGQEVPRAKVRGAKVYEYPSDVQARFR